jgi:hypothetical protein
VGEGGGVREEAMYTPGRCKRSRRSLTTPSELGFEGGGRGGGGQGVDRRSPLDAGAQGEAGEEEAGK